MSNAAKQNAAARALEREVRDGMILGVGTGSPGPQPGKAVSAMLQRLDELKQGFQEFLFSSSFPFA